MHPYISPTPASPIYHQPPPIPLSSVLFILPGHRLGRRFTILFERRLPAVESACSPAQLESR
eukprot:3151-Pyramimonas_sp.AAC.1